VGHAQAAGPTREQPVRSPVRGAQARPARSRRPLRSRSRQLDTEYDFRRFEARLNAQPQFITEIDGLESHFIAIKAPPVLPAHGGGIMSGGTKIPV
jgi:hypothetical protein